MNGMLPMIRTMGDQLRWSAAVEAPGLGPAEEIVVAGMGGSGVAGDYLAAAVDGYRARVTVHKGYGPLPGWAERVRPLVIAISYSGNTEETIDAVMTAAAAGCPIATITTGGELAELADHHDWPGIMVPGGLQPRAAIGYLAGSAMRIAGAAGAVAGVEDDLAEAATLADDALAEGSQAWRVAESAASGLKGRISIIYGGGPISSTAAGRLKTQINENAKMPAWWSAFPELDHNELAGWETLRDETAGQVGVVTFTDRSDHPRVEARRRHSSALTTRAVPWVAEVSSWGESPIARLISLTTVGDLTSLLMARQAGADPVPVVTIEKLKTLLTEDSRPI